MRGTRVVPCLSVRGNETLQTAFWGPSTHGARNFHLGQSSGPAWPGSSSGGLFAGQKKRRSPKYRATPGGLAPMPQERNQKSNNKLTKKEEDATERCNAATRGETGESLTEQHTCHLFLTANYAAGTLDHGSAASENTRDDFNGCGRLYRRDHCSCTIYTMALRCITGSHHGRVVGVV